MIILLIVFVLMITLCLVANISIPYEFDNKVDITVSTCIIILLSVICGISIATSYDRIQITKILIKNNQIKYVADQKGNVTTEIVDSTITDIYNYYKIK